jgi:hypothetical protein
VTDYAVAVISHRRPTRCAATLTLLAAGGVDRGRVHVFVSDPADVPAYQAAAPGWNILPGSPTLPGNRNHVSRHFPAGHPVVCSDDDIDGVVELTPDGKKLRPVTDLHSLFLRGFAEATAAGATLWGLNSSANPFYMSPKVAAGLKFIIGNIHGLFNRPDEQLTCACKDDYERSLLRYEADGVVVRLDYAAAKHAYDGNAGGLAAYSGRTAATAQADVDSLMRRWPGLVHLNTRRKSPYPEILLRAPRRRAVSA